MKTTKPELQPEQVVNPLKEAAKQAREALKVLITVANGK